MDIFQMMIIILLLISQVTIILMLRNKNKLHITGDTTGEEILGFTNKLVENINQTNDAFKKDANKFNSIVKTHNQNSEAIIYKLEEKIDDITKQLEEETSKNRSEMKTIVSHIKDLLDTSTNDLHNMNKSLSVIEGKLKDVINITQEKENDIKRYQKGYDQKILKRFTSELFKIYGSIDKELSQNSNEALQDIQADLLNIFDKNDIEKVNIQVNELYDNTLGNHVKVRTIKTDKEEEHNIIKEIRKDGFYLNIDGEFHPTLQDAEIILYEYRVENKGEEK